MRLDLTALVGHRFRVVIGHVGALVGRRAADLLADHVGDHQQHPMRWSWLHLGLAAREVRREAVGATPG
jgi:hypothetical protein